MTTRHLSEGRDEGDDQEADSILGDFKCEMRKNGESRMLSSYMIWTDAQTGKAEGGAGVFFLFNLFIHLFIFGCFGSTLLRAGFL